MHVSNHCGVMLKFLLHQRDDHFRGVNIQF